MGRKYLGFLLAFILLFNFVLAVEDSFDSFVEDNLSNSSSEIVQDNTPNSSIVDNSGEPEPYLPPFVEDSQTYKKDYTLNFYIALLLLFLALLIAIYFVYSFLRKPKNRWKK